ncbi:MAG: purine-nucleoside phosphorylase [Candidatus Eisenbacteria bacterium]|nr:purine-nucleoside phosphorylase [Candidatus Eisenbacteria bacterium]
MPNPSILVMKIREAEEYIRARTKVRPKVGLVLGTGLGDFDDRDLDIAFRIPFGDIPHFPVTAVESHAGEMLLAKFHGHDTVIFRGRIHGYEGYRFREVAFPVRVMKALGVETVILTNAVGGMNPAYKPGTIMIVTDHINLTGDNPLIGPNDDELGPRFPDMSEPYDRKLIALAEQVAAEKKVPVEKGVFVGVMGPNLETAAEYRFLRMIGADVVGMSLIAEDIAAIHGSQKVLAFSVVTDMCLPDELKPASIPEILKVAGRTAPKLMSLVAGILEQL